jgi:hypothetical protein
LLAELSTALRYRAYINLHRRQVPSEHVLFFTLLPAAGAHREAGDFTVYKGAPGMAMMCMRLACTPELDADAKLLFLRMGQEYLQVHLLVLYCSTIVNYVQCAMLAHLHCHTMR